MPHNDEDYLLRSLAAISKELPTAAVDPMYGQIGAFIVNTHGAGHQRFDEVKKCAFVWFGFCACTSWRGDDGAAAISRGCCETRRLGRGWRARTARRLERERARDGRSWDGSDGPKVSPRLTRALLFCPTRPLLFRAHAERRDEPFETPRHRHPPNPPKPCARAAAPTSCPSSPLRRPPRGVVTPPLRRRRAAVTRVLRCLAAVARALRYCVAVACALRRPQRSCLLVTHHASRSRAFTWNSPRPPHPPPSLPTPRRRVRARDETPRDKTNPAHGTNDRRPLRDVTGSRSPVALDDRTGRNAGQGAVPAQLPDAALRDGHERAARPDAGQAGEIERWRVA